MADARPAPRAAPASRTRPGYLPDWSVTVPPVLTLALMLWGIGAPSYWRDEAATVSAVSRSLPQLFRLLGRVDAVHGLYYLMLWPAARLLGTQEITTRLPSAVAMAAAAAGIAAIGRRLRSRRAGLCAGLVFAVIPAVSERGHDARPYAMVTAAAVLASYLLIRAAGDPRRRRFAAYSASLALVGYLHLFALLLVPAHAVALLGPAGLARRWRAVGDGQQDSSRNLVAHRWLASVAGAAAAVAPLGVLGWLQRGQIGWIPRPGWHDVVFLVTALAGGSAVSAALAGALAVLGAMRGDAPASPPPQALARRPARPWPRLLPWRTGLSWKRVLPRRTGLSWKRVLPRRTGLPWRVARSRWQATPWAASVGPRVNGGARQLTWLAAAWLVLPPAVMLVVSQVRPVYYFFYVIFCLPAAALLAGSGLAALAWPLRAAACALLLALVVPGQLALRAPGSGGSLRATAQLLRSYEQPGDAVIYPGNGVPAWNLAYPDGFGQLRDIGLAQPAAVAGRLEATRVALPVLQQREHSARRLWVIEMGPRWQDPARYLTPDFGLVREWQPGSDAMKVWLYAHDQRPAA